MRSALAVGPDLVLEGLPPEPEHSGGRLQAPAEVLRGVPGPIRVGGPAGTGALRPGERAEVGGVRVVALPAGPPTASWSAPPSGELSLLVAVAPGVRILWAPDTGPLPAETLQALEGADLDIAVLDCRDTRGRADPAAFGHRLSRLRSAGALREGARVVAAGLSHEGAGPQRLARALAPWGAQVLPDGAALTGPRRVGPGEVPRAPLRTILLGGASSGKSALAEEMLAAEPQVVYAATGPVPGPDDPEWAQRVSAHRDRRPPWWTTMESCDVPGLLREPGPPVLLDSVGTWLAEAMHRSGAWDDEPGWAGRTGEEMERMRVAWRGSARRVVAVCEDVGSGVVPATSAGRRFRDLAGKLNAALADESERVFLCVAGRAVPLDLSDAPAPLPDGGPL
ncbi:MAG: adenosylcobinamide kinase / adenosylcobinamide-phosphate guanylyltransferase [Actinomycetota bacterium]|nr:adenosylcobinamide kinase / adenosylcobinamide-phosphate guanylyltransferase [Actinomycetota bacterium]